MPPGEGSERAEKSEGKVPGKMTEENSIQCARGESQLAVRVFLFLGKLIPTKLREVTEK